MPTSHFTPPGASRGEGRPALDDTARPMAWQAPPVANRLYTLHVPHYGHPLPTRPQSLPWGFQDMPDVRTGPSYNPGSYITGRALHPNLYGFENPRYLVGNPSWNVYTPGAPWGEGVPGYGFSGIAQPPLQEIPNLESRKRAASVELLFTHKSNTSDTHRSQGSKRVRPTLSQGMPGGRDKEVTTISIVKRVVVDLVTNDDEHDQLPRQMKPISGETVDERAVVNLVSDNDEDEPARPVERPINHPGLDSIPAIPQPLVPDPLTLDAYYAVRHGQAVCVLSTEHCYALHEKFSCSWAHLDKPYALEILNRSASQVTTQRCLSIAVLHYGIQVTLSDVLKYGKLGMGQDRIWNARLVPNDCPQHGGNPLAIFNESSPFRSAAQAAILSDSSLQEIVQWRAGMLTVSHLCHQPKCCVREHLRLEPLRHNVRRNACKTYAIRQRKSGLPMPELCDDHDPPCLLWLAAVSVEELSMAEFLSWKQRFDIKRLKDLPNSWITPEANMEINKTFCFPQFLMLNEQPACFDHVVKNVEASRRAIQALMPRIGTLRARPKHFPGVANTLLVIRRSATRQSTTIL